MVAQGLYDALTVLGLFFLRIGVPIAITIAAGLWLERKLHPEEQPARPKRQLRLGLSPRGAEPARCWDVKRCDATLRAQCAAFQRQHLPCWLAQQVAGSTSAKCFGCDLYTPQGRPA